MTEYYFLVLTSPVKQFHNVLAVKEYLEKKNNQCWLIRSETGEQGNNPHLNVVLEVSPGIRTDNIKRDIMKAYYPAELLEKNKNNKAFKLHGCKGKKVIGDVQLSHICVYLAKECDPEHEYFININIHELTKNLPTYEEHKTIYEANKLVNQPYEKLLELAVETYHTLFFEDNLKYYDNNTVIPPPSSDDFKAVLKRLTKLKYNLIPVYNKMKPFFLQFTMMLGADMYMESYIDRMVQDLQPKREYL